jgi:hypothetical protein
MDGAINVDRLRDGSSVLVAPSACIPRLDTCANNTSVGPRLDPGEQVLQRTHELDMPP